jgi:NIMA (never in mitosis gene a)-related kinase
MCISLLDLRGFIFRDIKTMNIFLTRTDLIKLGDFGISRILETKSQMAETVRFSQEIHMT